MNNEKTIYVANEVSEIEYKKLKKHNNSLREVKRKLHSFEQLHQEYTEYMSVVESKDSDYIKIIRAINNYLSSYKGFIDKSMASLKRNGPKEMTEYFDKLITEMYDNTFEYRFIYNLRNYSQHVGNPISRINSILGKKKKILINKQNFINSHSGMQNSFKKELHNLMKDELDINNAIMVVQIQLQKVQEKLLNKIIQSKECILKSANYIKVFYEKHSKYRGSLAVTSQKSINSIVEMIGKGKNENTTMSPYIIENKLAMKILENSKIIFRLKGRLFGESKGFPILSKVQSILEIPKLYLGSLNVKYDGIMWIKLEEKIFWGNENTYDSVNTIYMPTGLSSQVYKENINSFLEDIE